MPTQDDTQQPRLTRRQVAAAVDGTGWRLLAGRLVTAVPVADWTIGTEVAAAVVAVAGDGADGHLRVDLRDGLVVLSVQTADIDWLTEPDLELVRAILDTVSGLGLPCRPAADRRSVQVVEIAIDALDIPAVRPFWKAVLGYVDEVGNPDTAQAVVDPAGQGPSIWFQQLDNPREQRNRIHFDVMVGQDEADARVAAAVAAGGTLLSTARARAFWVLADPEGNEICVCTWQDREK